MRYLGLDLGTRTLGISMSDITRTIATSFKTIKFPEAEYDTLIEPLKDIVNEYQIEKIVLGLPKNMNNSIGDRARTTLEFKALLEEELKLEVIMQDERLSTVEATNYLLEADLSRKKRKTKVDAVAANIILQTYLDREREEQKNGRKMTFKVVNDEGKEVECEVLFTFESDETKKNYIVYTDNTLDEEGNTKVYASIYNPDEDETKLLPIETDKEWKIIETILEELQNEIQGNEAGAEE